MKLYLHSWYLNIGMTMEFWQSIEQQVPALMEDLFGDAVKEVQLYDDYGMRHNKYLFVDEERYYYPLSVIMKKKAMKQYGDHQIAWIGWRKADLKGRLDPDNPFCTVKPISFAYIQAPPAAFVDALARKPRPVYERSGRKVKCTTVAQAHGEWGNVSQFFLDVFGTQISERLQELVPQNKLTNHWGLRTRVYQETVERDGWFYRSVTLLNPHAEALDFAVKWQESVDITDDITNEDIHVVIAEDGAMFKTQPIAQLKQFLADGTYVFSSLGDAKRDAGADVADAWRRMLGCDVEWDASWPDVVCELHLAIHLHPSEITALFAKYSASYNRWHSRPIHYISEPVVNGTIVQVHIDFGDADPHALQALANNIKKAKWPVTKICFS